MTSTAASGIQEAVTDHLANGFVGADIVAFGAGFVALESDASMFTIELEQLRISLSAEFGTSQRP